MPEKESTTLAEAMRQRDLLLQVERFLKYAPRGTDEMTIAAEAGEFDARLAAIEAGTNEPRVRRLRARLENLRGGNP